MDNKKKVLIVGSGMMVPELLSELAKDYTITIASNILEDAEKLAAKHPGVCTAIPCDVSNHQQLVEMIKQHDVVISYIPPFLHKHVAKACLEAERHMITASYIDDHMKSLDEEVKAKGLIFMNEVGVDPGIDIMSTMKVKDEIEEAGGKIIGYESWCGGLPDAIDADNPLAYKFSWAPQAVFKTSKNGATFLKDGQEVTIEGSKLLTEGTTKKDFHRAYKLEGYPNRDSVSFKDAFGMSHAQSFVRGTLRYEGFGIIMKGLHDIGITSEEAYDTGAIKTMKDLTTSLVHGVEETTNATHSNHADDIHFENDEARSLCKKLLSKLDEPNEDKLREIIKSWIFFELFADKALSERNRNALDALCEICNEKFQFQDGEKDMIFMKHLFTIEDADGKIKHLHSTMVNVGDPVGSGGNSIMCKTVGLPTALAAKMILEGEISARGVQSPKTKEWYVPMLAKLEENGIRLTEEYQ